MALLSTASQDIVKRAKKCQDSFDEFVRFVGGLVPAPHQVSWIKALQEVADHPIGARLQIVAPPGSGKTTIMVLFLAFMIGRAPDKYHGLLSYADIVGWSRSRAVKELIESSPYYRLVFPDVKPGIKWGDTEFIVEREAIGETHPTLRAGGTNSAVIAYRINGLLVDDPHDQKNSATGAQREKVYGNWESVLKTRLTYGRKNAAWVVIIGTRWADQDLLGRLYSQKGWARVETKALTKTKEGLRSFWEEGFPLEELEKIRYESPALFSLQYMNDTSGGETGIIRRVKCYYEQPLDADGKLNMDLYDKLDFVTASGWDTAFKQREANDFSVGYIGGLGKDGRVYILHRYKERYSLPELMDVINVSTNRFRLFNNFIEDAASGTPAIQTLMVNNPHIPTEPVPPTSGGKHPRAHSLAPYLHGGHVLFPAYADWFKDAQYNLTFYPYTDHDDDIDALYILVENLLKTVHPSRLNAMEMDVRVEMS